MNDISVNIPATSKKRIVIIGGGFGGLNLVKHIDTQYFQVVLFDKHNYHTFQPLLYQVATAGLQPDAIVGPLRKAFSRKKDFYFRMLKVTGIDTENNMVHTPAGALSYDYLVIANGSRQNYFGNLQLQNASLPLKSIPDALNLRSHIMQLFEWANLVTEEPLREAILTMVIVGGGPTGVEVAGALAELRKYVLPKDYPQLDFSKMKIYLVEGVNRLLPPMSAKAGAYAQKKLEQMGIIMRLNTLVKSNEDNLITLNNGEQIHAFSMIWSAGVTGDILPGIKKEWTEKGRILTDEQCRIKGSGNIFAIGDIALMKTGKYPNGHAGVAQPAIQMGKYIGKHLKKILDNQPVKPFKYFDKGSLATIGRGKAVADIGKMKLTGRIAWWIWLFVHITFLISFRNKMLVMTNWIWNYFTFDKGNRLIIRPYVKDNKDIPSEQLLSDVST